MTPLAARPLGVPCELNARSATREARRDAGLLASSTVTKAIDSSCIEDIVRTRGV